MAETRSILYLLTNVPLDPNYEYTMDFDNITAQSNYFDTKIATLDPYQSENSYSYIKSHEEIKVPYGKDELNGVNYFYFDNEDGKRWYAFILDKQYINPETTKLIYKIDPYQTFMFDYSIKESFVDREHQDRWEEISSELYAKFNREAENIDIGNEYNYTLDHTLVTGEHDYLINWIEVVASEPISNMNYSSSDPTTFKNYNRTLNHKGYHNGLYIYLIPFIYNNSNIDYEFYADLATGSQVQINSTDIVSTIRSSTAVLSLRLLDYCPIKYTESEIGTNQIKLSFTGGYNCMRVVELNASNFGGIDLSNNGDFIFNLAKITTTNDNNTFTTPFKRPKMSLTPPTINTSKNIAYETKLRTYPYYYFNVSDDKSDPLTLKYENFDITNKYVKMIRNYGIQNKIKYYLEDYNNDSGKFYNVINNRVNELPLTNSAYVSYMAQNKAAATTGVAVSIGETATKIGLGLATGGIGLAVAGTQAISTAGNIANHLIKMQDLKDTPDSIRQQGNNAEFDIIDFNNKVGLYLVEIKDEFKTKVFNYFYHYGYKCNDFKTPNIRSRYYFNYIKTIGINLDTNIDGEYRQQLENIYNNGVTIWHYRDANTFKGVNNFTYENVETSLLS